MSKPNESYIRVSYGEDGNPQIETNYNQFIAELTRITRQYGVAIQSVGGVFLADAPAGFGRVTYIADITSGDLYPEFPDT